MTPTSDERREVAELLRERPVARNIGEAYVAIVQTIGVRPCLLSHEGESGDRFDAAAYADVLDRLADLIDPTCEVDSIEPIEYGEFNVFKLTCGHGVMRPREDMPPAYCDECGARVVSDDD